MYDYDNDKAFFMECLACAWKNESEANARGGGGANSREFWIGVCREGSWTLTLFKD